MTNAPVPAGRILYDVTHIVHWQGKYTGIPRVIHELAMRFTESGEPVVFVSWVKEVRTFCAVDLAKTLAGGNGIVYIPIDGERSPAAVAPVQRAAMSQSVKRLIKALLKGIQAIAPSVTASIKARLIAQRQAGLPKVTFQAGDRLFIPWGEWWDERFTMYLEELNAKGVRLVQLIHDMSPIVVPQLTNANNTVELFAIYCRRILPISTLVVAVSHNTMRDIARWAKQEKLPLPPVKVIRNGDTIATTKSITPADPAFAASGLEGNDFVLCVGTIEIKKNHTLLYYVYKLAKTRGIALPKLVIVGRLGWLSDATVELMTKDPEIKDNFVILLNTSDEELSWLYDHAMFTILPSLYEGWGIPVAESLARRVPCLCSNTSSMTEIAEGVVEHFSPLSTDECLAGIQRWLDPKTLAAARRKTKSYKPFTWDQTFRQVLTYIKEI
jgi:glycosyltransferase involved in cell wall biosynthesis